MERLKNAKLRVSAAISTVIIIATLVVDAITETIGVLKVVKEMLADAPAEAVVIPQAILVGMF